MAGRYNDDRERSVLLAAGFHVGNATQERRGLEIKAEMGHKDGQRPPTTACSVEGGGRNALHQQVANVPSIA